MSTAVRAPAEASGEYEGYSAEVKNADPLGLAPSSRSTVPLVAAGLAAAAT